MTKQTKVVVIGSLRVNTRIFGTFFMLFSLLLISSQTLKRLFNVLFDVLQFVSQMMRNYHK